MAERYDIGRRRAAAGLLGIGAGLIAYNRGARLPIGLNEQSGQTPNPPSNDIKVPGGEVNEQATEAPVLKPDPMKNAKEVAALREGEAHTFTDFEVDVFWVSQGLGNEAYIAAATLPSSDGTHRDVYGVITNAQCLYDAVRTTDAFKEGDTKTLSLVPGQSLTRVILKGTIVIPKMVARAGRNLEHGKVLELTTIEDEKGNQASCGENSMIQNGLATTVVEGRALSEIPNLQPTSTSQ